MKGLNIVALPLFHGIFNPVLYGCLHHVLYIAVELPVFVGFFRASVFLSVFMVRLQHLRDPGLLLPLRAP